MHASERACVHSFCQRTITKLNGYMTVLGDTSVKMVIIIIMLKNKIDEYCRM